MTTIDDAFTECFKLLVEEVKELRLEIKELKAQLEEKTTPDIRSVTQKVKEDPQTEFDKTLAWTQGQVNQRLESLTGKQRDDIVREALGVKPADAGPGSPVTQYLNENYATIAPKEAVLAAIGESIEYAKNKVQPWGGKWADRIREDRSTKLVDEELAKLEKKSA
jgi:hypothetical protein